MEGEYNANQRGLFSVRVLIIILYAFWHPEPVNAECSTIDPLSLSYTESNFAVQQTRLTPLGDFELEQCSWQVWGVATILLGGVNSDTRVYWFDCYHNTLLDGLRWYRVDSNADPETSATPGGGVRFSLTSSNVANSLGLYACEATDGSVTLLNITDAVIGLNPVEGNVEAFAGDSVTLSTYISSANGHLTLVRWRSPGGDTLQEYPGPGQTAPTTPSRLVLSNVTTDDSGTYNVSVFSTDVGVTYNSHTLINLDVLVPSHITVPALSVLTSDEWEDIEIECFASGSGPIIVSWARNNSLPLPPALRFDTQTSTVNNSEEGIVTVTSRLTISSILYSDRGGYRCSAYNSLTTINHTDTTDFVINVNPVIRIESEGLSNNIVAASLGTSLTIKCFGSGTLNWARTPASEEIFYTESHPTQNLLTLLIPNFVVPATYICSSDISPELRKYVSISTHAHLSVFISTEGIFTFRDSSVSITAYIHSAEPVTSVLWYRNGTVLDLESDPGLTGRFDSTEASLEIESFGDQDVGLYVVVVNNSEETANTSVQVMYPDLTTVRVSVSHQVVEVGERVEVNCTGLGSGPLTIIWTFENGRVITEGSQLVIAAASLFHSGLYTCTVSSPYYQDQTTFDLTVLAHLSTPTTPNLVTVVAISSTIKIPSVTQREESTSFTAVVIALASVLAAVTVAAVVIIVTLVGVILLHKTHKGPLNIQMAESSRKRDIPTTTNEAYAPVILTWSATQGRSCQCDTDDESFRLRGFQHNNNIIMGLCCSLSSEAMMHNTADPGQVQTTSNVAYEMVRVTGESTVEERDPGQVQTTSNVAYEMVRVTGEPTVEERDPGQVQTTNNVAYEMVRVTGEPTVEERDPGQVQTTSNVAYEMMRVTGESTVEEGDPGQVQTTSDVAYEEVRVTGPLHDGDLDQVQTLSAYRGVVSTEGPRVGGETVV